MQIITLPKQAIYTLHTLSKSVTEITGYRCKLSKSKELIHLLKLASLVKNQRIKVQFFRFLLQLNAHQLKRLLRSGIHLPAKIVNAIQQPFWVTAAKAAYENVKTNVVEFQRKVIGSPLLAS